VPAYENVPENAKMLSMRLLPSSFIVHRMCPKVDSAALSPIGKSRDGKLQHLARAETIDAFNRMNESARKEGVQLHVIWAFRDPLLQHEQFEEAKQKHGPRNGIKWLAPPGFSEHQTGWVLDIGDWEDAEADDNPLFERTKAFQWLKANAARFQFELSFPPGNWQGVSYEPWHWRYVGTSKAQAAFHPAGPLALWVWGRSWVEAIRWWFHP
jgi:D-alanyl-D-alanine carboxypeptidase